MSEDSNANSGYRVWLLLLGPVLALLVLLCLDLTPGKPETTRTAAVAVLMSFWWITGTLPLAATALLPIVLFPLLGVLDAKEVAAQYINDTIFLFLGGFFVALAMQRWDLHRRIALRLLLFFGVRADRLLLGFMAGAFFLSMWISNTATTMMMLPIAMSVIDNIEERPGDPQVRQYSIAILLSIAYASSIGGTATLIGTPPNLSMARILKITFPEAPEFSFAQWMLFGLPTALAFLAVLWLVLARPFVGRRQVHLDPEVVRREHRALGGVTYEQRIVFVVFILLAVLWMTRADIVLGAFRLPGWNHLLVEPEFASDGTVAIAMGLLLFLIPARSVPGTQIMDWHAARDVPWGVILLFGGGFALAKAFVSSGLALWIGQSMQGLAGLPPILLVLLICLVVSLLTELTSNTAMAEMLLPIMASLALAIGLHPLLLMVPTTFACSFAFMLPVATPPNAIVFATQRLTVLDMVRRGYLLNCAAVVILTLAIFTLGRMVFQIPELGLPDWAHVPH